MQQSAAKRRRLAALQQAHAGKQQPAEQAASVPGTAISAAGPQQKGSAYAPPQPAGPSERFYQPAEQPPQQQGQQHTQFPYARLEEPLLASQVAARLKLPPAANCHGSVGDLLESVMVRNMPGSVARAMIGTRITDKNLLLDNPTAALQPLAPAGGSGAHTQRLAARLAPRRFRLSATQLQHGQPEKAKGGSDGDRSGSSANAPAAASSMATFAALQPLHELWQRYIITLLGGLQQRQQQPTAPGGAAAAAAQSQLEALLVNADLHGALLTVTSSRASTHQGRSGIVAKETARTFQLVGADDRVHVVPKQGCVFQFELRAALQKQAPQQQGQQQQQQGQQQQQQGQQQQQQGSRIVTLYGDAMLSVAATAQAEAAKRSGGARGRAATAAALRQQRKDQQRQKQLQQRERDRARKERSNSQHRASTPQRQRLQQQYQNKQQYQKKQGTPRAPPVQEGPNVLSIT